MPWFLWDIIIVGVLALCAWLGWRKGLILSVSGIVVFALSIWFAGMLAGAFANPAADSFSSLIGIRASDTFAEVRAEHNQQDQHDEEAIVEETLERMNVHRRDAERLANEVWGLVRDGGQRVETAVTTVAARAIMRVVLFIFFFIVLSILLHLLVRFINTFFEVPIMKQLNQFGGLAAGVLTGLVVLFAVAWAVRYSGFGDTLNTDNSLIMGLVQNITPFRIF